MVSFAGPGKYSVVVQVPSQPSGGTLLSSIEIPLTVATQVRQLHRPVVLPRTTGLQL